MKAIQFGAGNIGRGFIGAVLAQAGYQVVFADVVADLLDQINNRKQYTVHVTDTESRDIVITDIRAVHSGSEAAVAEMAGADLITTAVGLRILKFVAPAIAKGLAARMAAGEEKPLNIIACENGLKATSQLKQLTFALLSPDVAAWAEKHVGWPDAAVDRIVPPVRCEVPLDVAVEEYFEWDVERSAFVGAIPAIAGMTPVDNLEAYVERQGPPRMHLDVEVADGGSAVHTQFVVVVVAVGVKHLIVVGGVLDICRGLDERAVLVIEFSTDVVAASIDDFIG